MAKSKSKVIFSCQNCGAQRPRWEGKCTDCGAWNSYIEEVVTDTKNKSWLSGSATASSPGALLGLDSEVSLVDLVRFDTGIPELNRVLGGGVVQGGYALLGGAPGIGKSTLLLQMAGGLAKFGRTVLYISGEESVQQTAARAHRLGIHSGNIKVACESNLHEILKMARSHKQDIIVVDSIQTVFMPELESAPGSVSQVRECAGQLMSLAKQDGISVILVGHVNKEGNIAGPKVLEHMVDTVLSFEGDTAYQFRILRTVKNRFGAANEMGVFQMVHTGLSAVENPSELFLSERSQGAIGSAVFAGMEGTRPLLCEIQALAVQTPMPMPRRTALGVDLNRLHLIIAVLEKHGGAKLYNQDIFINIVGGLKIDEPSVDLAIAAALVSSLRQQELDPQTVYLGEIGLTGEVRAVSFIEQRIKESIKLGFTRFVLPASNRKAILDLDPGQIKADILKKIRFIKNIGELLGDRQSRSLDL